MSSAIFLAIIVTGVAVVAVLFMGLLAMARTGGKDRSRRSNRLMRFRIVLQALAILLVITMVFLSR